MNDANPIGKMIQSLLDSQRFAALATNDRDQPHLFLMAFAATPDLRKIVVATERHTHKFPLLQANRRVALLIDNRENRESDTREAVAVTVLGEAAEVTGDEADSLRALYLSRHPYLAEFAASPSCAMVQIHVGSYRVVRRFQEVAEWRPDSIEGP